MPIAIVNQTSTPNKTVTFDFTDVVVAYVVGVSYWSFSFGSNDHHVKTLSLAVNANQPTSKQITASITARLDDDSGNTISNSNSMVNLSCIAVTVAADGNIVLANANNIASGSDSANISLPSSTLSIGSAFLSGWSLSQSGDHHVKLFQTTAGFRQNGNIGDITSQAQMKDDSGNASSGAIDGGLVAASMSESGIIAQAVVNKQTTSGFDVDLGRNLSNATALLQSLVVTFGSNDHHVKTIGGGSTGWKVSGSKVTLNNARAFITDDSGNTQSNTDSSVSMIVFGIPS